MFIHNKKGVSYVTLMKVLCSYFFAPQEFATESRSIWDTD